MGIVFCSHLIDLIDLDVIELEDIKHNVFGLKFVLGG
jgi:hypothetical protein